MTKNKDEGSLKYNVFRVLIANFWVAIVGFLGSFIFPRVLTIDDYAYYHTFTMYVGYIAVLHLGFPSGMVINYAGKNYEKIDKAQYKSELILLSGILSIFSIGFIISFFFNGNKFLLYIGCAIFPVCFNGSYNALLQAWGKFKKYSRLSMFMSTSIPICALIFYVITGCLPGDVYIIIYLGICWGICLYICFNEIKILKGIHASKLLSKQNIKTEKTGFSLVIGNYMNTLFGSADRQFVSWFFGTKEFAFYSFSMAMQTLMTVFITSISQPLLPAIAAGQFKDDEYSGIRRMLFVFGSFSCCAYFAISIIVKLFITKYEGSLEIIRLYFIVFPAMAVVNCLYVNLYKVQNKINLYLKTLAGILICAIVLNSVAVLLLHAYYGVALATAITYYVWLFVGSVQFDSLRLETRDILYLVVFVTGFYIVTTIQNDFIGLLCSFVFVAMIGVLFYKQELRTIIGEKALARKQ